MHHIFSHHVQKEIITEVGKPGDVKTQSQGVRWGTERGGSRVVRLDLVEVSVSQISFENSSSTRGGGSLKKNGSSCVFILPNKMIS